MEAIKKIKIEKDDLITAEATKNLLPDYEIGQLFDINTGISTLLRHTAGHLMNDPSFLLDKKEWEGIYWLTELQLDIQKEIRNRVPDMLTESIDLQLNERAS